MMRFTLLFLLLCAACKQNISNQLNIELSCVKTISLSEKEKKIGRLVRASISSDSMIYILDRASGIIHQYNFLGNYIKSFGGRGNAPNEFPNPVTFCIDEKNRELLIAQYQIDIRIHRLDTIKVKSFFVSNDNIRLSSGDLYVIEDGHIAMTSFFDVKDNENSLCIIDKEGNVVEKFRFLPDEEKEYRLGSDKNSDIKENGDFVVSFSQSPALFVGNIHSKKIREHDFSEMREMSISKKRKKDSNERFDEMIELLKEERINYKVSFLGDTLVVRASSSYSDKGLKDRSFLSQKNKTLDFFKIDEEHNCSYLCGIGINGRFHGIFKGLLLIEESDEPDNRQFGLYEVKFITQNNK